MCFKIIDFTYYTITVTRVQGNLVKYLKSRPCDVTLMSSPPHRYHVPIIQITVTGVQGNLVKYLNGAGHFSSLHRAFMCITPIYVIYNLSLDEACMFVNLDSLPLYHQRAFSPLGPTASWPSHRALMIYMFVVVIFDALAQASNIRIERR